MAHDYVLIGGERDAAHIEVCRYDREGGTFVKLGTYLEGTQVGAVRINPAQSVLYCTNHVKDYPGHGPGGGGQIVSVKIDRETGKLTELNRQPSYGTMPVMMDFSPDGRFLIAANHSQYAPITELYQTIDGKYHVGKKYDDAPTVLYPLLEDGSIGEACDVYLHGGCSAGTAYPNPHPHCVFRSPLWELYVVCDKGADRVYIFRIDKEKKRLTVADCFDAPPRMAPRYAAFHPTKPFLITNNEMQPVVFSFSYDASGKLRLINALETPPTEDTKELPTPSDLKMHPSGKYVYGLMRRTETILAIKLNQESGEISLMQTLRLDGREAKACAVSPDGRFLFVTAKKDNRIARYAIGDDGCLAPTDYVYETTEPDNITFLDI